MTNEIAKEFFSIEELCARWDVTAGVVRRELKGERLHGARIGKQWRVSLQAVRQYERERMEPVYLSSPAAAWLPKSPLHTLLEEEHQKDVSTAKAPPVPPVNQDVADHDFGVTPAPATRANKAKLLRAMKEACASDAPPVPQVKRPPLPKGKKT